MCVADVCASRSIICDPKATKELASTCERLRDDISYDVPLMLAICPPLWFLNRTTGHCQIVTGAPGESMLCLRLPCPLPPPPRPPPPPLSVVSASTADWNATDAENWLEMTGLKRPWGVQTPGNSSDHNAAIQKLVTVTVMAGFG